MPGPCSVGSRVCSGMRMDYLQKGYVDPFAACSGSVSAPRGQWLNAALKADHPARGGGASGRAELKHDVAPGRRVLQVVVAALGGCARCST
eukprot:2249967-Prymnesium_polylepis.1